MLSALFNILAPAFITVGLGFVWVRLKLDMDPGFISRLVINIGSPALAFHGLTTMTISSHLFATMALVAGLTLVVMLAINFVLLKLLKKPLQDWLHPLTFPNWGNLGLPLCLFAYGDEGLALAIAFYAVGSTVQLTIGVLMASGSMKPALLMRMPMVYAIGVALLFMLAEARPPQWLLNTTELVGGFMIPMMLLALGASLAQLKVTNLKQTFGFVIYRYLLGIGVVLGLGLALGLEGPALGVAVIQGAMPIAVLNYLLAARFGKNADTVASLVFLSTVLSMAVIPVVLAILLG